MLRYIYIVLLFSLLFVGCGYKADPIYINDTKGEKIKQ